MSSENSRRGYVVVGHEEQLAPYYTAVQDMPGKLSRLQSLLAPGGQQERLGNCEVLIRN